MRTFRMLSIVVAVLLVVGIAWVVVSERSNRRAKEEQDRMVKLESQPALTTMEKQELAELQRRVGKWRADHPGSP